MDLDSTVQLDLLCLARFAMFLLASSGFVGYQDIASFTHMNMNTNNIAYLQGKYTTTGRANHITIFLLYQSRAYCRGGNCFPVFVL
jgi:hypothetical protein